MYLSSQSGLRTDLLSRLSDLLAFGQVFVSCKDNKSMYLKDYACNGGGGIALLAVSILFTVIFWCLYMVRHSFWFAALAPSTIHNKVALSVRSELIGACRFV